MILKELEKIKFTKNYNLEFLNEIRCDQIASIFGKERVIYIVPNLFTDNLSNKRKLSFKRNSAIDKKTKIYRKIKTLVQVISIDYSKGYNKIYYPAIINNEILHLPIIRISSFIDRIIQIFFSSYYLIKLTNKYDSILFYNFYLHTSIPALVAKLFLRKRIYVDFEDAYEENKLLVIVRKIVSKFISGAILVNDNQLELLPKLNKKKFAIINAFADLSYLDDCLKKIVKKINFIYSGKIDEIRGVDLIVDFSWELKKKKIDHLITITGYGNIDQIILNHPKYEYVKSNFTILGFVERSELDKQLNKSDVALSFDRPDEDKNKYLFPSKTQLYASYKLPILRLV